MGDYIEMIAETGFTDIEVLEERTRSGGAEEWCDSLIDLTLRGFKNT